MPQDLQHQFGRVTPTSRNLLEPPRVYEARTMVVKFLRSLPKRAAFVGGSSKLMCHGLREACEHVVLVISLKKKALDDTECKGHCKPVVPRRNRRHSCSTCRANSIGTIPSRRHYLAHEAKVAVDGVKNSMLTKGCSLDVRKISGDRGDAIPKDARRREGERYGLAVQR